MNEVEHSGNQAKINAANKRYTQADTILRDLQKQAKKYLMGKDAAVSLRVAL